MKILVLTKRQYMGKDLLDDRFGRFWELPLELARRGHEVRGISLSYRKRPENSLEDALYPAEENLRWCSVNLLNGSWPAPMRYIRVVRKVLSDFQPDVIWACSDAYHAIIGQKLAAQSTAKVVIDLYDNFESYPATRVPGVPSLLQRAVRAADALTLVSGPLAEYVRRRYRSRAPHLILENAVRADLFRPMEREACRNRLALPLNAKIVGTAGALHPSRGIEALFRGFHLLSAERSDLHLALAGPRSSRVKIPAGERVHDLGVLPLELVPTFLNALDVAVVCNRDSAFGRYNFPQKAREIVACEIPMAAADTGSMKAILREHPECLFASGEPASLANVLRAQLRNPKPIHDRAASWSDMAETLEKFLLNDLLIAR